MFKQRGENQYPGMCPGIMQPLRGESLPNFSDGLLLRFGP